MKGISTWIWVIGGIIIGVILVSSFFNVYVNLILERHKQNSIEAFEDIVSTVNTLCAMNEGQKILKTLYFSDIVDGIYAYSDEGIVRIGDKTYGDYICMNITNDIQCELLDCKSEMIFISNEGTLLSLVDKLMGRHGYREHKLEFSRTGDGVSILPPTSLTSGQPSQPPPVASKTALFFLTPNIQSLNVGDTLSVDIKLNTNSPIVALSAYLNFDTTKLGSVSIDSSNSAFGIEAEGEVSNNLIKISRGEPTPGVTGSNILVAKVNFIANDCGITNVNFAFTSLGVGPSRVILDDGLGTDILTSVTNGVYTISC